MRLINNLILAFTSSHIEGERDKLELDRICVNQSLRLVRFYFKLFGLSVLHCANGVVCIRKKDKPHLN